MLTEKERELLVRCTDVYGRQEENEIISEKDQVFAIFAREELARDQTYERVKEQLLHQQMPEPATSTEVHFSVPLSLMRAIYLTLLDAERRTEPKSLYSRHLLLEIEGRFEAVREMRQQLEATVKDEH